LERVAPVSDEHRAEDLAAGGREKVERSGVELEAIGVAYQQEVLDRAGVAIRTRTAERLILRNGRPRTGSEKHGSDEKSEPAHGDEGTTAPPRCHG